MSKKKINKSASEEKQIKEPSYKKIDGDVTYVYNSDNRVIDSYIAKYSNFKAKVNKYENLEVR